MESGLHVFDTAIGPCGVAWTALGVCAVQLPESTAAATLAKLQARRPNLSPAAPPPAIAAAIEAVIALTNGQPADLRFAPLDIGDTETFERRVWDITHAIPAGRTLTYGEIARRLGDVSLSRAVGKALGANPVPIIVPCHRVLAADGRSGGFSGAGGVATKLRLLNIERAAASPEPMLFGDLPLAVRGSNKR